MSKNVEISQFDERTFISIRDDFATNVLENYKGDAEATLAGSMKLKDSFKMIASRFLCKRFENAASPEKHVRAMARFLDASLPPLERAFGHDYIVNSLPEEAKDERVINIFEQNGQTQFANLCREALSKKP